MRNYRLQIANEKGAYETLWTFLPAGRHGDFRLWHHILLGRDQEDITLELRNGCIKKTGDFINRHIVLAYLRECNAQ